MGTLYHYRDCPYCFKVKVYLHERGLTFNHALVTRGAPPPELSAINPLRRLPVWVTDEGKPVFGSNTIIEFLEGTEGAALLPEDPLHRARCWMAEELARDGLLEPLLAMDRVMGGKDPTEWDMDVYGKKTRRIRRMLDVFEALLGGRQWLVGEDFSVADISVTLPLTILERYGLDLTGHPGLADLRGRLDKRYSVVEARKDPSAARSDTH